MSQRYLDDVGIYHKMKGIELLYLFIVLCEYTVAVMLDLYVTGYVCIQHAIHETPRVFSKNKCMLQYD
uniref:Uncharacterized protein n=1 Tax=Pararge aegeria TaxID=116150 RepID=S4PDC0_9NEOP